MYSFEIYLVNVIFFNIYMYMSMCEFICINVIICLKIIIFVVYLFFFSYMIVFFKMNFGNFYNKIIMYMYYVLKYKSWCYIVIFFFGF